MTPPVAAAPAAPAAAGAPKRGGAPPPPPPPSADDLAVEVGTGDAGGKGASNAALFAAINSSGEAITSGTSARVQEGWVLGGCA